MGQLASIHWLNGVSTATGQDQFDLLAKGKLATLLAQKSRPLHFGMDEDSSAWQALVEQLQKALQQHLDKHGAAFLEQDARRKCLKVVTATELA